MTTIATLFPDEAHTTGAQNALLALGVPQSNITLLQQPAAVWQHLGGSSRLRRASRSALIGAVLGLAMGAFLAIPATILNCSEFGCPTGSALTMALLICLYGAFGGGMLGAITGADDLEHDFRDYVEGVRHGATLLLVQSAGTADLVIYDILARERGALIHTMPPGS